MPFAQFLTTMHDGTVSLASVLPNGTLEINVRGPAFAPGSRAAWGDSTPWLLAAR